MPSKEALDLVDAIAESETPDEVAQRALDLAKREVAEALIRAGCERCRDGVPAYQSQYDHGSYRPWFHEGLTCPNSGQHELLHQLKEREDGKGMGSSPRGER